MACLEFLSTVLCYICQPLWEGVQTSLRGAAEDLSSYLRGWVVGELNARGWVNVDSAPIIGAEETRDAVVEVPVDSTPIIGAEETTDAVVEVPVDSALIIGAEETLREILNHLRDDGVGIIGICGMGGIGKTTLLRKINNHLLESKDSRGNFNVVIWVTVSREDSISNIRQNKEHNSEENDLRIPKIQKQIGRRLGLSFTDSESAVEEQAELLFQALSKKRFLLLLDDLWEELDFEKVGIPHRDCKVAFTTRSLQVCSNMDAAKIVDVKLLDETQSWELFCSKFITRAALQNESIQPLARQVVQRCGGLPLALITVGRAMANRKLLNEWKHAIEALDDSANELQGMDKVISRLKFSYDYLENDKMRSALLYCAMYPEDQDIERKELIDHWIGEGLLDVDGVNEHIDRVRNRGDVLISNLQHACLLEPGIKHEDQYVKMHDAVRDMALWINNHEVGEVHGFYVLDGRNATPATMTQSRGHLIRRIWVHNSDLEGFPHHLTFPNICTLRMDSVRFDMVIKPSLLQGFLSSMRTLRVLDLSHTGLQELPVEIGLLLELRYLNLSYTGIRSLPKELGGLIRLRQLEFQGRSLVGVPREAIAGLSSLQVLNLLRTDLDWDTGVEMKDSGKCEGSQQHSNLADDVGGEGGRQLQFNDLEGLGRLQELHIRLRTSQSLLRVLSSDKLCRCTRHLHLDEHWNKRKVRHNDDDLLYEKDCDLLRMVFHKMGSHLRDLRLDNYCTQVRELRFDLNELPCLEQLSLYQVSSGLTITIVGRNGGVTPTFSGPSLKMLHIHRCEGWKELKFVGRFPSLERFRVEGCHQMEKLTLDDDDGVGTARGERQGLLDSQFPMLREIELLFLSALRSIGRQPLLFPSLQIIFLLKCPTLRRLPLGPSSAPKLRMITCDKTSWEWGGSDGQDIKPIFMPFFVPHYYDYY